jgi:hypothetical protein
MCIKTEDKVVILVTIFDKSESSTISDSEFEMALFEFLETLPPY